MEEQVLPAPVEESQAERVRQSLVMLDIHLPAIALPDGVHCRAFVGACPSPCCVRMSDLINTRHCRAEVCVG